MLALWGLVDRRLSRPTRLLLLLAPLLYALAWLGLSRLGRSQPPRLRWRDAAGRGRPVGLALRHLGEHAGLIRQQPWTGVGFGEFNLAWTLTPFPGRPVAFFDHTHNLPLQLAVELGLPLAGLVLALLVAGLWRAWRLGRVADEPAGVTLRSAWVMLLLIALHSLLEYPLWYAYFLLPTAWLCGYGLGTPAAAPRGRRGAEGTRVLFVGGVLLVIGSALSLLDYVRVAQIFMPAQDGSPLSERIAAGRRSWLFAHHADYAAVTTDETSPRRPQAFEEAPHYLMDTRLMMAWANALARAGEVDKARHLAQRLREFRNPLADEFFEVCDEPHADAPAPFQCEAPARVPGWRDYLR